MSESSTIPNRPLRLNGLTITALVFGALALGFLLTGGILLLTGRADLPRLFTPAAWPGGEMPDVLAVPLLGMIFGSIGAACLLVTVILLLCARRIRLRREELLRYGTRVQGTVTDVIIDRTMRVGGRYPLRAVVTVVHPVTDETLSLRTPPLWDATPSTGDVADVLFDPMDPRRRLVLCPPQESC